MGTYHATLRAPLRHYRYAIYATALFRYATPFFFFSFTTAFLSVFAFIVDYVIAGHAVGVTPFSFFAAISPLMPFDLLAP